MRPAEICNVFLGQSKIASLLERLSSPQTKAILKKGSLKVKAGSGFVSLQKRRQLSSNKILAAISDDNDEVAGEFLQQWLLNHRRQMLMDYLDSLGVKHSAGETNDSFFFSTDPEQARHAAIQLMESYPSNEAAAYLCYVAHQQRSNVFDAWEPLQRLAVQEDAG